MIYLEVDNQGIISNSDELPDTDYIVGKSISFRIDQDPGRVYNTVVSATFSSAEPCKRCVFSSLDDECPWDPESGEVLCNIFDCAFVDPDTLLEDL